MPIAELDATYEARHALDPERPHNRESLVWVLALPEHELGAFAYTWVDAHGSAGTAGVVFGARLDEPIFELVDGIDVPDDMPFSAWEVGPMRATHDEPLRTSQVAFAGERVSMDFSFEAIHPAYAYGSHAEGFPTFFADERYEQGGRARGALRVDGAEVAFDGHCHRDHSWGARDWGGCTHYKWLNFLAGSTSVHLMDLHGFGRTTLRGYVHADGETSEVIDARLDYELDGEFFHRALSVELDDGAGRTTSARLRSSPAVIRYPINPRLTLVDVAGAAEVAGEPGVCYAEMAWMPEYLADRTG